MNHREAPRQGFLRQAWLVILLAFAYGGALAGVQITLAPRIAENRRQETYQVIPLLVPGADHEQTAEWWIQGTDGAESRVYQTHDPQGNHNGWVLLASGQGFADRIEVLIGLDAGFATITGLYVLDQKETPGLGDYIRDAEFRDQFRDKSTDVPLAAVKAAPHSSHEILALSGATVSSWSVCAIVNAAVDRLREPILQKRAATAGSPRGDAL